MMFKFLLVLLALSIPATAQAETKRMVLFFTASWCGPCVTAKKMYHESDMVDLVTRYDDNYLIDIDKHPSWKKYYKVTHIPTVIIADTEYKNGKLEGVVLHRWVNQGKPALKSALVKYLPKEPAKYRRPILNLLQNPAEFLKNGLDKREN